ncbi:MAG: type II secretion system F family protein [Bdellovibrionales bacterium]
MENIVPPLRLLWSVKKNLEMGHSPRQGIQKYIKSEKDDWQPEVTRWLARLQQGHSTDQIRSEQSNLLRQQILLVLEKGLKGEPILTMIRELEDEIHFQIELEFQRKMDRLPFLMLIPLALFFFPACAIILIGPLVMGFLGAF